MRREGGRIILEKAGLLPERGLGGVYTNPRTAFTDEGYPELVTLRRRAEKDLPEAVSMAIKEHLAKRRGSKGSAASGGSRSAASLLALLR